MKDHLDDDSRKAVVAYRIEKSDLALKEAESQAANGFYDNAVTRLYYACYYIASALLIKNKIEANTHAGVKRMLSLKFILTGLLEQKYIGIYTDLINGRQLSDYEDFIYQTEKSYLIYYNEAVDFCNAVKKLL